MKTLDKAQRIPNMTGNDRCRWCLDDGLVVAQTRGPYDEMGPCPFCQKGYLLEFGDGSQKKLQWPDGFWQGRPPTGIVPLDSGQPPLSREENARRMRALLQSMHGAFEEAA